MNLKVMTTTVKRETFHEHGQGWLLVPQLGNKSTPRPVAEAAKAFGDNECNVPKLLASFATGMFRNSWRVPLRECSETLGELA